MWISAIKAAVQHNIAKSCPLVDLQLGAFGIIYEVLIWSLYLLFMPKAHSIPLLGSKREKKLSQYFNKKQIWTERKFKKQVCKAIIGLFWCKLHKSCKLFFFQLLKLIRSYAICWTPCAGSLQWYRNHKKKFLSKQLPSYRSGVGARTVASKGQSCSHLSIVGA